mgnify:FL=1
MTTYKLKWESNSRVKHLAAIGTISSDDIIDKTTTDNFPDGCATVRLREPRNEMPFIVIHFKGASKKAQHSWSYQTVPTARVSFGGESSYWTLYNACTLSGELDFDAWPLDAVDAVVEAVKGAFENEEIQMGTTSGLYKAVAAGTI